MRDILKMIVVLTAIATVMGLALGGVESYTRDRIQYSELKFVKGPAILAVLMDYDNDPIKDHKQDVVLEEKEGAKITKTIFPAKKNGKCLAVAFEVTGQGFGGALGIMIGIDLNTGALTGMRVMTHKETPGLGARAVEPAFYDQFSGVGPQGMALSGQGGKINAMSGATITSNGVITAVKEGLELFHRTKEKIEHAVGTV